MGVDLLLGRTHVITTTATGLSGLYALYYAEQTLELTTRTGLIVHSFAEIIGFDFYSKDFSMFLFLIISVLGLVIGALLPDIDSKNSILGRYVPFIQDIFGHRTITHTIWVVLGLFIINYFFGNTFTWMISIGYLLHIIQDSFSRQGVDWFWPFGKGYKSYGGATVKRGFHLGLYSVGGVVERVWGIGMILVNLLFIYKWIPIIFF